MLGDDKSHLRVKDIEFRNRNYSLYSTVRHESMSPKGLK